MQRMSKTYSPIKFVRWRNITLGCKKLKLSQITHVCTWYSDYVQWNEPSASYSGGNEWKHTHPPLYLRVEIKLGFPVDIPVTGQLHSSPTAPSRVHHRQDEGCGMGDEWGGCRKHSHCQIAALYPWEYTPELRLSMQSGALRDTVWDQRLSWCARKGKTRVLCTY